MEEINLNNDSDDSTNNKNKGTAIGVVGFVVVFVIILAFVLGVGSEDGSTFSSYLNYSNYSKIQDGMSYSEVVNILDGNQGVLDTSSSYGGYNLSYYTWSNNSGTKCIVVGFQNGKVCAKSQYGLG